MRIDCIYPSIPSSGGFTKEEIQSFFLFILCNEESPSTLDVWLLPPFQPCPSIFPWHPHLASSLGSPDSLCGTGGRVKPCKPLSIMGISQLPIVKSQAGLFSLLSQAILNFLARPVLLSPIIPLKDISNKPFYTLLVGVQYHTSVTSITSPNIETEFGVECPCASVSNYVYLFYLFNDLM